MGDLARTAMVAAHLADRERLVRTHRELAAIICEVRRIAQAHPGSALAQRVLRAVGDTGVCTLSVADATGRDRPGGCEPSWGRGTADYPEPEPSRFANLHDIDQYQEQQ